MLPAFIRLVRWPNLLIVALIFVLVPTCVVGPVAASSGAVSCLSPVQWFMLALASILIAASGNVINDIFDQDIDRINRPDRIIVGKAISEKAAWDLYYLLAVSGIGLGAWLCLQLGSISNSLVFVLSAGGLYFYSFSYKRQLLIGNLVVALLSGLVPVLPLFFQMDCASGNWTALPWAPYLLGYGFFAFLTTLLREVIKDMEDVEGDAGMNCRTLPIVAGLKIAQMVAVLLVLLLIVSVARLQMSLFAGGPHLLAVYLLAAVQLPALAVAYFVIKGTTRNFHLASKVSKMLMVGGILSMLLVRFAVL